MTRVITELAPHPTTAQLLERRREIAAKRPDLRQRIANEDRLAGRIMLRGGDHATDDGALCSRGTRVSRQQNIRESIPGAPRTEHEHQVRLFAWRDAVLYEHPDLRTLIAIPNARSSIEGCRREAEGGRRPSRCL